MKKMQYLPLVAAVMAMAVAFGACDRQKSTTTSSSGIATVVCDASYENIISQEIDVFEYIYRDASIIPYYTDEKAAFDSLLDQKTKCIVVSRELTQKELDYLKAQGKNVKQSKIAVDAIAVIVNPANPVNVLSKKELAEILSGKYTSWGDIEPTTLGDIKVVFDSQGSSTVHYMRDSLLNGGNFGPNIGAQGTPQKVFEYVAANKNAIGLLGVSWISTDMNKREVSAQEMAAALEKNDTTQLDFNQDVKVIKMRGNDVVTAYKPYQAYIFSGEYPLYRPVYMIITAPNGTLAHGFYSFVTGFQGQKLIQTTGILPATVRPQIVEVTN